MSGEAKTIPEEIADYMKKTGQFENNMYAIIPDDLYERARDAAIKNGEVLGLDAKSSTRMDVICELPNRRQVVIVDYIESQKRIRIHAKIACLFQ